MGFIIRDLWTAETPGPRTAVRAFNALIALIGIVCIAMGTYYPASGVIYYIILAVTTIWSALVSIFSLTERTIHPGFVTALDFALAVVHFFFGILNARAASGYSYGRGNDIVAIFLLVAGILHLLFFVLACRDTHVRRRSTITDTAKEDFRSAPDYYETAQGNAHEIASEPSARHFQGHEG
ncbi:hypothetical protein PENANT_c191G05002 [Penicillium antarcticum]|uniref:Uncharacterized protein n=1 Tax=Penicillium antarcticum TaxID=416450 RepID=A0A1V6PBV1_9EURO|nr:uncharacterized protein N7508_011093 [Penicillium antarcticum]KAJ5288318.1 hypothetical protein N7508_011093 [Penicillium antarcticum]OQD73996.1 hypothetical protein PENANT_c191G05002 [Penicillium antarcticum]